jgi:hypothetical protein
MTSPTRIGCLLLAAVASFSVAAASADKIAQPTDPRAMFRALGATDADFGQLTNGVAIDAEETGPLLRILYRLRRFPLADIQRWALDAAKLDEALQKPGTFRGSIFQLRGRVAAVEPCRLSPEQSQRYEMPRCFRCRLLLDSPARIAEIYTENVPPSWRPGAKPDVRGGASAVFLKYAAPADGRPVLVFVAPRLAWYSDDLLGRLGMDFGLLDSEQMRKPFDKDSAEDREAFYQMLAAAGRAKPGQLLAEADAELPQIPKTQRWTDRAGAEYYSVVPLFNEPATQRGRLVALSGVARRIQKILVAEPDVLARFGIDHYYEVFLFTDDSQGNPLTFCVRELPEGMPYGNQPHYGESIRVAGFFFKTWSYRVPTLTDPALTPDPKTHRQLSPLLVGRSLEWTPAGKPSGSTVPTTILIVLLILILAVIWGGAWRSRRRQQQRRERIAAVAGPPRDV